MQNCSPQTAFQDRCSLEASPPGPPHTPEQEKKDPLGNKISTQLVPMTQRRQALVQAAWTRAGMQAAWTKAGTEGMG